MVDNKMGTKAQNFEGDRLIFEISEELGKGLGLSYAEIEKMKKMSLRKMENYLDKCCRRCITTNNFVGYSKIFSLMNYVHQVRMSNIRLGTEVAVNVSTIIKNAVEAIVAVAAIGLAFMDDTSEHPSNMRNIVGFIGKLAKK